MKSIPIIINNRNRLAAMKELVEWFLNRNFDNIVILDNDSTFPALLQWYDQIKNDVHLVKLRHNWGGKVLWEWPGGHDFVEVPYIYTDSDIVLHRDCPDNFVEFMLEVWQRCGKPHKVGPGLDLSDIPDHYSQKARVLAWEGQFWTQEIACLGGVAVYKAAIDTTLALYTEWGPPNWDAVRTGYPYLAKHLPWYVDSKNPPEEDVYFLRHSDTTWHHWAINGCYSAHIKEWTDAALSDNPEQQG